MAPRDDDGTPTLLRPSLTIVVLLAVLSALGQFATSVYTPSIPDLARAFGTSMAMVQLTLTVFLITFAVAQLIYGPVSDRFGRRLVLHCGMALFLAGTAGCALADSVGALLGWRVVQAAGAGAGVVTARAVIRDCFDGAELSRVMAVVTVVFALVPGLTPLLGGILHDLVGWRATFAAAAVLGLGAMLAALALLPETNLRPTQALGLRGAIAGYRVVLRSATFLSYSLAGAASLGAIFAFLAGSPAVFIDHLGVSATEYGFYPPLSICGFIIGSLVTGRLVGRLPGERIAAASMSVMSLGVGGMLGFALAGMTGIVTINLAVITFSTGMGLLVPVAMAESLRPFPERAATAAAMAGFLQMGAAALGTVLVGLYDAPFGLLALPAAMATMLLAGLLAFALPAGARRRESAPRPAR